MNRAAVTARGFVLARIQKNPPILQASAWPQAASYGVQFACQSHRDDYIGETCLPRFHKIGKD